MREPKESLPQGDEPDRYDAGLLGDGGGGDVEWWRDYMRAELERAHEFYSDQFAALARSKPIDRERVKQALEKAMMAHGTNDNTYIAAEDLGLLADAAITAIREGERG